MYISAGAFMFFFAAILIGWIIITNEFAEILFTAIAVLIGIGLAIAAVALLLFAFVGVDAALGIFFFTGVGAFVTYAVRSTNRDEREIIAKAAAGVSPVELAEKYKWPEKSVIKAIAKASKKKETRNVTTTKS